MYSFSFKTRTYNGRLDKENRISLKGVENVLCLAVLSLFFLPFSNSSFIPLTCPDGYISDGYHNGLCCTPTECQPGHYVQPCQSNYGNDLCRLCPQGTYMEDATTSEFIVPCIPYDCPEGTVPQLNRSTSYCSKHCRCDVDRNYCGYDACSCRKAKCGYREQLTQLCGCEPLSRIDPTETKSTREQKTTISLIDNTLYVNKTTHSELSPSSKIPSTTTPRIPSEYDSKRYISDAMIAFIICVIVFTAIVIGAIIVLFKLGKCQKVIHYHNKTNVTGKHASVAVGQEAKLFHNRNANEAEDGSVSQESDIDEFDGFN